MSIRLPLNEPLVLSYGVNSLVDLTQPGQVTKAIEDLDHRIDALERRGNICITCGVIVVLVGFFGSLPAGLVSNNAFPVDARRALIITPIALGGVLVIAGIWIKYYASRVVDIQRAITAYQNDPAFRTVLDLKQIQIISLKNLRREHRLFQTAAEQ